MEELSPIKRALIEQRRLKARIEALERWRAEPIAVIGLGCRFPGGGDGPAAFWRMLRDRVDGVTTIPGDRWDVDAWFDPDPDAPGKISTRFGGFLQGIDQFDAHFFGISPREAATMDPQQRLFLEVGWEALEHAGLAPDRLRGTPTGVFVGVTASDYYQLYATRGALEDIDAYVATGNSHSVTSGRLAYVLGLQGPAISVDTACSSSLVAVHLACDSLRAGGCRQAIAGGVNVILALENFISLSKARMMAPDGRCKAFDAAADGFVRSEGCGVVVLKRLSDAQADGDRVLAVIRGTAMNQDGRSHGLTAPNGPSQQAVIRAALANAGLAASAVGYVEAHGTGTALGDPIEVQSVGTVLGEGRTPDQPLRLGSVKTNLGHLESAAGVAGLIKAVLALQHREIPGQLHFVHPSPHIPWDQYPFLSVPTTTLAWESADGLRIAGVSAFGFSGTNVHMVLEEAPEPEALLPVPERPVHLLALSGKTPTALHALVDAMARRLAPGGDSLADICWSSNTARAALPHRVAVRASSAADMRIHLERFAAQQPEEAVTAGTAAEDAAPRVLFTFPDRLSGMGRQLYDTEPAFRRALVECDALLQDRLQPGLVQVMYPAAGQPPPREQGAYAGPILFAIEYALAMLWQSWGIRPAAVLGRGVGEYAAATVAGVFRLQDALALVTASPDELGAVARGIACATPQLPMFSALGRRIAPAETMQASRWSARRSVAAGVDAAAGAEAEGFTTNLSMSLAPDARNDWPQLLDSLARLYVAGAPIDWRGLDLGRPRRRVAVPSTPFQRQRHWFIERPAVPAEELSRWHAVTAAAARQAGQVPVDVDLKRFAAVWSDADAFTTASVARTLAGIGAFVRPNERHTVDSVMASAGILPLYRHLVSLWLRRLARAGLLRQDGDSYLAVHSLAPVDGPAAAAGEALREVLPLHGYLERCREHLPAIITGRRGPLETLFPDGSFDTAEFFYQNWGLARYYNGIVAAAVRAMVQEARGRSLRVLEVGAGSGGTSASVLPELPGNTEYWYTDLSETFFSRAEAKFADYPFVRFHRVDLDADPAAQGVPTGGFDLVLAANSVHATRDLGRAIEHARDLLAPHGLLVLYEVTQHLDWFEMSVALIEGWQHHQDQLRGETPLLSPAQWEGALRAHGFDRVVSLPEAGSPAGVLGHHVIIASAPVRAVATAAEVPSLAAAATAPVVPRMPATAMPGDLPRSAIRDRLLEVTPPERRDLLRAVVRRHVIAVMRVAEPQAPGAHDRLMDAGVDSLMALELKKRLVREFDGAVELPSTLIFDHPTIDAIAGHVLGVLELDADRPKVPARPAGATTPAMPVVDPAAIAAMSEEQVEVMLNERLRSLAE